VVQGDEIVDSICIYSLSPTYSGGKLKVVPAAILHLNHCVKRTKIIMEQITINDDCLAASPAYAGASR